MRVKRVILGIGLLICFVAASRGQSSITLSGRIIDNETDEPLIYATIGILGKPIGTVSNSNGEFDFHIPVAYLNDTVSVSMLGYQNFAVPLNQIGDRANFIVRMEKGTILLKEVVISDSLSAGDIVRIAINKIDNNYPMDPYQMEAFYRDLKSVNGRYISLLEAALTIFDRGYSKPKNPHRLRERVGIKEIRKSYGYDDVTFKWFDQTNLLEDLLLHNNVKYRTFPTETIFFESLERREITQFDNKPVYVVSLNADYLLNIYVNVDDYSIIRIEFEIGDGETPVNEYKKSRKWVNRTMSIKRVMDFKNIDGKMYLSYLNVTYNTVWHNLNRGKDMVSTELFQELLINQIIQGEPEFISPSDKMKKYGLQYQDKPYNKEFWESYNVIKDSPLEAKVLKDLESEVPLELQFEDY